MLHNNARRRPDKPCDIFFTLYSVHYTCTRYTLTDAVIAIEGVDTSLTLWNIGQRYGTVGECYLFWAALNLDY